ncbi:FAD-binding and (Fe-S)-binding domain-containing protein [Sphingobacterium yanglingense]|uniref:FAD/FMN-containing dehydrogenase n=1 Tax=Sphingobacterium yanglingense TaxID=1437280 RepID=A0A4R6WCH7_9SPHI|nr:FAD-binding and (Fe-S)-binding domain-containing protein [Sphingobacterium yanglingense]TDQ75340.1 FAD/FMN-containing dehydrogenase [Sphingobacterium yanglingense]
MEERLQELANLMEGELYSDQMMRTLYATDASAYREMPLAVALPRSEADIRHLIEFALANKTSLIPRTAGTSLAGQVVGAGIVVDVSKHFTNILEVNAIEQWVRVQPGVIRDELNIFLKPLGLYFGPETSTANRAMIGGMVGNNSCGSNSLIYHSTREHTLEVHGFLSDGTKTSFKALSFDDFIAKCNLQSLEGEVYRQVRTILGDYNNQEEIRAQFPKPSINRRNTGYAIDLLLETDPFTVGGDQFNFCKLICGSEGTLFFMTEIKVHVDKLPTRPTGLLCVHFETLDQALRANLIALEHKPLVSELMDHYILECTASNLEQRHNRFFVEGTPEAILIVEYEGENEEDIRTKVTAVETAMRNAGVGYYFPVIFGSDRKKVWDLRKAGLGLLSNMPGDEKPVAVIEDTAVAVEDLPAYIAEFNTILAKYGLYSVHYAHAATGELHLRPILNLKTEEGNRLFREIALEIAKLVKKFKGSLSGEHGDGRLRGEFIPYMIGDRNYQLLKDIKQKWDPQCIFNPGKIVDSPAMNTFLRYEPGAVRKTLKTVFRYPGQDILGHAEQCNGSGDCRKSELSGGTMCPSYMASRNEKDTTRARANILREFLTHSTKDNPFDHPEIKEIMDLCLSCKGCKIECPSSVDMAKMKADFLQQYHDVHGVPLRSRMIGNVDKMMGLMAYVPSFYNWSVQNPIVGKLAKRMIGFATDRTLPLLGKVPLRKWFLNRDKPSRKENELKGTVYFFCDEFTNYNDLEIGQKSVLLLEKLGYEVLLIPHEPSGRALLSKGLLRDAKKLADKNVKIFSSRLSADTPLLAVEPSAILTFRDEYVDLVSPELEADARRIAPHAMLIEEFLVREYEQGNISPEVFDESERHILLHTHCQQKAWKLQGYTESVLKIMKGARVKVIPSGCCGMAGSFGYEREHYDLSMQVGNLVLFPAVNRKEEQEIVIAPGTSCRHQIKDGTGVSAVHPIEVLYQALV